MSTQQVLLSDMTAAASMSVLQYAETFKLVINGNNAHGVLWVHIPNIMTKVCGVAIIAKLHFIILLILYDAN
jgi:hypothetical protein